MRKQDKPTGPTRQELEASIRRCQAKLDELKPWLEQHDAGHKDYPQKWSSYQVLQKDLDRYNGLLRILTINN